MTTTPPLHSASLWQLAWLRLRADRFAMLALTVLAVFFVLLSLSYSGLIATDWRNAEAEWSS